MKKRAICLLLVALMLLFAMPITALAEDTVYKLSELKVGDKISTANAYILNDTGEEIYTQYYKYKDDRSNGLDRVGSATVYKNAKTPINYLSTSYGFSDLYYVGKDGSSQVFSAIYENRPSCVHSFSEAWTYNENGHYHVCTNSDCNVSTSKIADHTDDGFAYGAHDTNGKYGECSVCGYCKSKTAFKSNITVKADGIYVDGTKTNLDDYGIYFEPASGKNAAKLILAGARISVTDGTKVTEPVVKSLVDLNIVTYGQDASIKGRFGEDYAEECDGLDAAACIDATGHKIQISGVGNLTISAPDGQQTYDEIYTPGDCSCGIVAESITISRGEYNGVAVTNSKMYLSVIGAVTYDFDYNVVMSTKAFSCEPTIVGDYSILYASETSNAGSLPKQEKGTKLINFGEVSLRGLTSTKHIHSNSELWTADGKNGHYHACTIDGCDVTDFSTHTDDGFAYAAHTYGTDDKCTVCGFEKPIEYTVTFDTAGGSKIASQQVESGEAVTQPTAPTKDGYTFVAWLDANGDAYVFDTPVTKDITLTASWSKNADPINYKIIEGANSTWDDAVDETPTFRSNADFSKFVRVELDGKVLDPANYTAKEGSTIIELKPAFAAKLAPGKHTINIVSTDGNAATNFYIEEEIANTDGGLLSEATMSTAFVGFGIVGLSAVFYVGKKKKVR